MGSFTATYRIPKARLPVRVYLRNRKERQLEVFVPLRRAQERAHRVMHALLDQGQAFLPSHDVENDEWFLLNLDAVVWAAVERSDSEAMEELELFDHHCWIRIELMDGSQLEGELFYSAPRAQTRVVDHLNTDERFLFVHGQDQIYLVNKSQVATVQERPTPAPRPVEDDEADDSTEDSGG